MVELLERRGYSAESRRKVMSSRLGFAIRLLENFLKAALLFWFFGDFRCGAVIYGYSRYI